MQAKKTNSRLTAELSKAKHEVSKNQMQKEKNLKAPIGVEMIDNTLQIITQMQQQKKGL